MADLLNGNLGSAMRYGVNAPRIATDNPRYDINMFDKNYIQDAINPMSTTDYALTNGGYNNPMGSTGFNIGALQGNTQQQGSNGSSALGAIGSAIGIANPIIGVGLGIKGYFDDKAAQKRAEKAQELELEKLGAMRAASQQRYIGELDSDAARRQMILRGQMANTPAYQAMMSNLAKQNNVNASVTTDNMQKQGLGENSGMSAAIASNNLSNIGSSATMGAANQMNTANRVYGGLQPSAMTTRPETLELGRQQGFYNEASDYGGNLAPMFDIGSSLTKGTIGSMYRDKLKDDVQQGFAIGKSGGNL